MKNPIVICFNIQRRYFDQFKLSHFESIKNLFQTQNIQLFPIINDGSNTIEKRAQYISQRFPEFLQKNNFNKVHVVASSISGLDFRAYLNIHNQNMVESLTTISTPHKLKFLFRGSFLFSQYNQKKISESHIEPLCNILGLHLKSLQEINQVNMMDFNLSHPNQNNIQYFSIGASKLASHSSDLLKYTTQYIADNKEQGVNFQFQWYSDNDGVFAEKETEWGNHLLNFELDHSEMLGLGQTNSFEKVYKFASDNISHHYQ